VGLAAHVVKTERLAPLVLVENQDHLAQQASEVNPVRKVSQVLREDQAPKVSKGHKASEVPRENAALRESRAPLAK
jgi:hypothetical protein